MEQDPKRLVDGFLTLEGGVDSGRSANLLRPNQLSWAVNSTMRGGFASPRSSYHKLASSGFLPTGRFQHADFFNGASRPLLMAVVDGHTYAISCDDFSVQDVTPVTLRVVPTLNFRIYNNSADPLYYWKANTPTFPGGIPTLVNPGFFSSEPTTIVNLYLWMAKAPTLDYGGGNHAPLVIGPTQVPSGAGGVLCQLWPSPSGSIISWDELRGTNPGVPGTIPPDYSGPATLKISGAAIPDPNSDTVRRGWSVTAEAWWIYQDNDSKALIFDGSSSRRAKAEDQEIPVGNVMEYAFGRVVVALPDRQSYCVGDLVYSEDSGTAVNQFRDSVLKFTETAFLNEGGNFAIRRFGGPANAGPITAMRQSADLNTSLGQGPLMIGTSNTVFSVNLPFDRTTWKNINNLIQTIAMIGNGPTGQDTMIQANGDIFYRSIQGVQSLFLSYREFGEWGNTPQSTEVDRALLSDPQWLLEFGSAVTFDNRVIFTAGPVITEFGIYHTNLVTMDLHLISSLGQKSNPVWEGSWTGLRVLKLVKGIVDGIERCFVFTLSDTNQIELWEILPEGMTFGDDGQRINWMIETARYPFGNHFDLKRMDGSQLFLDEIEGQVDGTLYYREDGNAPWRTWGSFSVCANVCDTPPDCTPPMNLRPQTRTKIRFPTPPEIYDESNQKLTRVGFDFQARICITGQCRIVGFRMNAYEEQEFPYYEVGTSDCVKVNACDVAAPCPPLPPVPA